ncbi:hypothetical protein PF002_g26401 [Phytophthora fragariae]|uniref:Uncharacterized protein n=1 Tax=Phytophthora fragariae TaxID=53985 RepID=A0A6A3WGC2_9STRA|nr:hypothetical protein PF002_g26401 [Phytophthora fragariae]KAE9187189.1 hypothetical protein PF004_g22872 [Phytophthora fragariae]
MVRNEELGPELPVPRPLLAVRLVLAAYSIHDSHIVDTTSVFVDSAVEMAFCEACKLNSVALLERIWNGSHPETSPSPADLGPGNGPKWSRRHYLRTDKHYNRFQFQGAIVEAAKHQELEKAMEMVQWLYDHFHGCIVPFGAVSAAASHGHLEILKFFKKHEISGKLGDDRDEIEAEWGNVVRWGRRDMEAAAENNHFDIFWWLHKHAPAPRYLNNVMKSALRDGNLLMLDWIQAHYLARRDGSQNNVGSQDDAGIGDTAESLLSERRFFMADAIIGGQLVALEWLLDNGYDAGDNHCNWVILAALQTNLLDILDWLIETKVVEAGRILNVAAEEGRLDVAKDFYACYWHKICAQHDYPLEPQELWVSQRETLWITSDTMISALTFSSRDLGHI